MADTLIDGESHSPPTLRLGPSDVLQGEQVDAIRRLEVALERQTTLREVAERALARKKEDHEDAFERLLVRCRTLESEKGLLVESQATALGRVAELEQRINRLEHEAHARDIQIAEYDHLMTEREAVLTRSLTAERDHREAVLIQARDSLIAECRHRETVLAQDLAKAEERSRMDASRLFTVEALRSKEVEAALAQAAEERVGREAAERRLNAMTASSSWKMSRPLRVLKRALRHALSLVL